MRNSTKSPTLLSYSPLNPRYCLACRKAKIACLCGKLESFTAPIPTHFWVHPKEIERARSTSWLAHRLAGQSTYTVEYQGPLPLGNCALLFPGESSVPWDEASFDEIVLVDGTWDECKAMIVHNPGLANMPKVCLRNAYQGKFAARKAPWDGALCTAEALGYLYLEMGHPEGQRLLDLIDTLNVRESGYKSYIR